MATRKLVVSLTAIGLAVAATPFILYGWLQFQTWYFHQERRLLREMRAAQSQSTNDSALARDVLLRVVPLGTDREEASAILRSEGFGCQSIAKPITETRLRLRSADSTRVRDSWIDCQALAPNVLGNKQWVVDLEFDPDGHLNDVGVAMWNIFL
jgi:hypothetical protein